MNLDRIIEECQNRPATAERKMILALAQEVKRLKSSQSKASTKAKAADSEAEKQ